MLLVHPLQVFVGDLALMLLLVWGRPPVRLADGQSEEIIRTTFTSAIRELERKPDCTTVSMPHVDEIRVNGVAYVSGDEACRLLTSSGVR
ncbi:hypothetical protein IVB25_23395 [Bradyrhizobium sp. 193]|uniref:hypothetical protein n=1 Tax=Bradyrhizobium sp. 193 TaxID=2782661 RepID=UPI001FFBEE1C|nr:hypothetical protein [Bradyrhizobium sp. 193]MCK1485554.1 hypothetical protein [Bradyrhizobium sp. 193]